MPSYRGISISLQSQYDARTIPEWPPPSAEATPSPNKGVPNSGITTFRAPPSDSPSRNTAEVYIPIYRGSQIWINYTGPVPRDTSNPDTRFYFFKLYMSGKCLFSWGVGAEDNWSGRVTFGIFDGGTDFEGRRMLEKKALFFPKHETNESQTGFEIRVFRSRARKAQQHAGYIFYQSPNAGDEALVLTNSGRMRKGEPRQSYLYALIDPKDEPYAIFKYQCRSSKEQLVELGVDMAGADDLDSTIGVPPTSAPGSPEIGPHVSRAAPAVPRDDLTAAHRLSFPPRLRLAPSATHARQKPPVKKDSTQDRPGTPAKPGIDSTTEDEANRNSMDMFEWGWNKPLPERPAGAKQGPLHAPVPSKISMTDSLRGLANRFRRRGDSRDEK